MPSIDPLPNLSDSVRLNRYEYRERELIDLLSSVAPDLGRTGNRPIESGDVLSLVAALVAEHKAIDLTTAHDPDPGDLWAGSRLPRIVAFLSNNRETVLDELHITTAERDEARASLTRTLGMLRDLARLAHEVSAERDSLVAGTETDPE